MGKSLLIAGAGSFATEVEELARLLGYEDIGFLDDNADTACCSPVLGSLAQTKTFKTRFDHAIVAFGNNEMREKYTEILKKDGYTIPCLVHPLAYVSPDATLAEGCIVRVGAVISRYVKAESGCIFNVGALVDHHCTIGAYSHILMGAVVRNKVSLAPKTWVSANQVVE